jgi:NitT/TauT family transport system substrate-binding protein
MKPYGIEHMNRTSKFALAAIVAVSLFTAPVSHAAEAKTDFKLAWSIYVGWMPWQWADENGIVDKWADKYGITIEVTQFNDYVESINQYTAGAFDALTVTNMDTLSIPAVSGVDSTAVIVGDFSNGNDALILKDTANLADIAGQRVNLVEFSVSHYLLARALDSVGLAERDVTVVNTSDADMIAAYTTDDVTAVVTWNPLVAEIETMDNANNIFDSSMIPGEIMDLTIVNSDVLEANPNFAKALAGAWYETMAIMSSDTPEGAAARAAMGAASGTDQAGYESQLATTNMFYNASDAVAFAQSDELPELMIRVRDFLFAHALLGDGLPSADDIGIAFADGEVLGVEDNILFRFTDDYMEMAADGDL